jgi:hypothetical protein
MVERAGAGAATAAALAAKRSAPLGQRATTSATRAASARSGRIHGFASASNTSGRPRVHSPECAQTAGS